MSELEGHSTAAFERLCAHYERERRRRGGQIEALQQRIERQSAGTRPCGSSSSGSTGR